jgi:hypothetical protein
MGLMHIPAAVAALERDLRGIFGSRLRSLVVYGLRAQPAHGTSDGPHAADASHQSERAVTHTLAVVDSLSTDDLRACTARVEAWHGRGLATPLVLAAQEFGRSLDAFPFEFGAILADHLLVTGSDPFDGLEVDTADLRRACEVQARGHWLHLREGYLETRGRGDALAVLIVESAPAFAALVTSVAQLDTTAAPRGTGDRRDPGNQGGPGNNDVAAAARHLERRLSLPSTASEIVALAGVREISSAEAERLFGPYLETVERLVRHIDTWKS